MRQDVVTTLIVLLIYLWNFVVAFRAVKLARCIR